MREKLAAGSGQLAEDERRQAVRPLLPTAYRPLPTSSRGFTLIELVITLTVLTILTMGVIPLINVSVKRQREQRLRDSLREMRLAIDQFHREAVAAAPQAQQQGQNPQPPQQQQQQSQSIDPRIRVAITDNSIFGVENPDRYPPDLETLVNGVSVTPLAGAAGGGGGGGAIVGLSGSDRTATDNTLTSTKKKIYLRAIPIDPMTGESDWEIRSTYDSKDASSWGRENVFDVRSKSTATALDGSKYSDW
jgi:general secretion pathway protein G